MLAVLGFSMIIVFMYLIMSGRLYALTALIVIPIIFALLGGFGTSIGPMMLDGVKSIAPTGIMLIFAILYFSIMTDAGLFEPLIKKILHVVKGDPLKVVIGTALLALCVSLDGDGATTYIIVVSAMLPLYKRLGINPLILTAMCMLAGGVMNILPWGGPTARAITSLNLDTSQVFTPLIPVMGFGALWVLFVAWHFGKREKKRLGIINFEQQERIEESIERENKSTARPKLIWVNLALTIGLMVCLVMNVLPLSVLFMIAFCVALIINYPSLNDQRDRINEHAGNALSVASMVFAAGIFTGILTGTKMVDAMAGSLVSIVPESLGPNFSIITAFTSLPFTFFMNNDSYYFGILPILAKAAAAYDIGSAEMARASLLGQPVHLLSPLVPSTYLLTGMAGVDFGDHQRFTLKWAIGTSVVMIIFSILLGVMHLHL
ncbi:CitMHS family transporter [Sphingobacterium hungaricum]|uniref:Citrate transporter n=1 Tax=Sphingobacterium hungaricum TaxID=2082723 RepID=A0A928YR51_9SPHI|nr:CitMHS family transporter [Sphingobacterium hungaricum]MBE8714297.1 citrate transporter [Sphingobacterium hungaricum]